MPKFSFVSKAILRLETWIDHPFGLPILAFLAAIDLFVMVIPTEGVLISSVLLRPKRWLAIVFWISTGSAAGALFLGLVIHHFGPAAVEFFFKGALHSSSWSRVENWVGRYGAPALAAIAASPLPQQPAVVITALGKLPIVMIFGMVWLGRAPKYFLFGWLASHMPGVLLRRYGNRYGK